jgi:hypothetical protein
MFRPLCRHLRQEHASRCLHSRDHQRTRIGRSASTHASPEDAGRRPPIPERRNTQECLSSDHLGLLVPKHHLKVDRLERLAESQLLQNDVRADAYHPPLLGTQAPAGNNRDRGFVDGQGWPGWRSEIDSLQQDRRTGSLRGNTHQSSARRRLRSGCQMASASSTKTDRLFTARTERLDIPFLRNIPRTSRRPINNAGPK